MSGHYGSSEVTLNERIIMGRTFSVLVCAFLFYAAGAAQNPKPDSPRPIAALDSVWVEELTWMEVRDAMKAGKTTILIPTGGVEQNGPYLATGKHNYILKA
jgi:creatinine amidohydrolase